MKNVLHVIRNIGDGGTEMFMMNVLNTMEDNEIKHIIVTYTDITNWKKEIEEKQIKIIQIQNPSESGIIKNIKNIYHVIKQEHIDVVHCYTHYNSGYVMLAAFFAKVKVRITHSHRADSTRENSIATKIYNGVSKLLINIFTNVKLACGVEAAKSLFYSQKKVTLLNNGINIERFKFNKEKRQELRKKYNIAEDTIVLGTVGRLDRNKNQEFMIKVFDGYHKKNSNSKMVIVGSGINAEQLKNQAKQLNLQEDILFLGSRNDVNELYNIFDVFLLTSYKEGLPFVLIEAQANGLNSIVSDSVDKNADLSDSIRFVSLQADISKWVELINDKTIIRKDNTDMIIQKGYSIKNTIEILTKIYK